MIYNVEARKQLALFVKAMHDCIKSHGSNWSNTEQNHNEIQGITRDALKLLHNYQAPQAREDSTQARVEYLEALLKPLRTYRNHIYHSKTWWQKILGLLGVLPPIEKKAQQAMHTIEEAHRNAVTDYNNIYYPDWRARFREPHDRVRFEQSFNRTYATYPAKFKLAYLSHHLMGDTPLNQHKILQGKVAYYAYHDLTNDLAEFIEHGAGSGLDRQTKTLFRNIREKIGQGAELIKARNNASRIANMFPNQPKLIEELALNVAYQTQKAIINLTPGSSLIIPGGFTSDKHGHATVIECTRTNENQLIFKLINTGAGIFATASWRALWVMASSLGEKWSIKVTSPLSLEDVIERKLIEKIVRPTIISSPDEERAMNEVFVALHNEGKLHDDGRRLTLQTNGTCTHSSLLEWLKLQLPKPLFALFHHATLIKARHRLQQLQPQEFTDKQHEVSSALEALHHAAGKTITKTQEKLAKAKNQLQEERKELCSELNVCLASKKEDGARKNVSTIANFSAYSQKKCLGNKLSAEQKKRVVQTNPLTPLAEDTKIPQGIQGLFKAPLSKYEVRTRKAIIAKQLAGHDDFIAAANGSLGK